MSASTIPRRLDLAAQSTVNVYVTQIVCTACTTCRWEDPMPGLRPSTSLRQSGQRPVSDGPWWRGLNKTHRRVLSASFLGWAMDGYETYALVVVIGPALGALLTPAQQHNTALYAGLAIGITLLGSGLGGLVGGTLADYVGRKPMMLWSITAYALLTGLTAFSTSVWMLIALRFLTGLALGSEWSTGASLIQETWPERSRTMGAAIVQSGFGFGSLIAALAWMLIGSLDPTAWRVMFVLGALPALVAIFLRTRVPESQRWVDATSRRERPQSRTRPAGEPSARLTIIRIFSSPEHRKTILLTIALSFVTIAGWYAISSFLPQFAKVIAARDGIAGAASWAQLAVVTYTIGSIVGYLSAPFIADRFGRRNLIVLFLVGSLIMTPITYLWPGNIQGFLIIAGINGIFTLGGFAWMPLYLPELFATTIRSTAMSTVFNSSRLIAWLGPIVSGSLVVLFGGIAPAAMWMGSVYVLGLLAVPFLKETKGLPLPE
ncbi:MFS transporter [Streptomyces sp. NPDC002205]|uniref:MFS transporter n=1 Tax=Streptomyces sp. NPDC002205 TaxID=3154411 RepID=UPI0033321560